MSALLEALIQSNYRKHKTGIQIRCFSKTMLF